MTFQLTLRESQLGNKSEQNGFLQRIACPAINEYKSAPSRARRSLGTFTSFTSRRGLTSPCPGLRPH